MNIINKTRNKVLADKAVIADTCFSRMKGLLGRTGLAQGEALVIRPCNSIHTLFMRFAIDVLFVDKQNKVVAALSNVLPWRLSPIYWRGHSAIELPSGVILEAGTACGDEIRLS